jgi:hypothetical protein
MPFNLAVIKGALKEANRCPNPHLTACRLCSFRV